MMDAQTLVVLAFVFAAAAYLAFRLWQSVSNRRPPGCGGCSGCARSSLGQKQDLLPLDPPRKPPVS